MADTPTWRSAAREAARLCPADEEALELIGRLPLVPISQLLPLSGGRSGRSVYACVERLVCGATGGAWSGERDTGPWPPGEAASATLADKQSWPGGARLAARGGLRQPGSRLETGPHAVAGAGWSAARPRQPVRAAGAPRCDRAWLGTTQAVVATWAMASTLGWSWTSPECDAARVRGARLGGSRQCMC